MGGPKGGAARGGRVCIATESLVPSGMGAQALTIARGAAAAGWDVTIAAPPASGLLEAARADGHAALALPEGEAAISAALRRGGYHLVHVHAGIGWEGHELTRAAAAAGAGVIRTEHLPWLLTEADHVAAYHAMIPAADAIIAVGRGVGDSHIAAGVAADRIHVIPNGIAPPAPPATPRATLRHRLGLDRPGAAPRFTLLHVGRMSPQKRHDLLLAAMARLPGDVALLLVGDGPDRAAIARAIHAQGLAGRVRMLGERADIACLMGAADALVLPSAFEGLPLTLLEAMAAGLPVVATPTPGIAEAIDPATGWLAEDGDGADGEAGALAAAIRAAIADPAERARRAAAARERQAADFTETRMVAATLDLYAATAKEPAMTPTRVAFVGAGGIAHRHLGVLEQMDDVTVVGITDPDADRAEEAARRCGARTYADTAAMLADAAPDALFICVPPFAHGAPEEAAIDADIPFFVEKPVGLDMAAVDAIAARVAAAGLVTAVGYHWRYLDTLDDVRHALGGRRPRLASGYWLDSTPPPRWWWQKDQSGGQLVEQTTHLVDLARVLMGPVTRVYGLAETTARDSHPGLDIATASTASLAFADGAMANFASTCLLGWNHRVGLHLFGEGFAVELTDRDVMIDVGHGRPVTGNRSDPVWREDRDFIDAVRGHENRIRCPYAEAAETLRVVLAIERSITEGRAITLEEPRP